MKEGLELVGWSYHNLEALEVASVKTMLEVKRTTTAVEAIGLETTATIEGVGDAAGAGVKVRAGSPLQALPPTSTSFGPR